MKKEDFKFGEPEYYIEDKYVYENNDFLLVINKEIFDDECIEYANRITEKYINEKDEILNTILEKGLRKRYEDKTDEFIKDNLGKPQINIEYRKDENHPNFKYTYSGSIDYSGNIDGHIISVDFYDDIIILDNSITLNG